MKSKTIVSHHPAHKSEVQAHGHAIINGLRFEPGENGLPTAQVPTEVAFELFYGVPGFQFFHEDGALAGESRLVNKPLGLDAVAEALRQRDVSLDDLRAMNLEIPGMGNLNGLLDSALNPNTQPSVAGGVTPDEAQARAAQEASDLRVREMAASMAGVDIQYVRIEGENVIVEPPEGITFTADKAQDGQDDQKTPEDEQGEGDKTEGDGDKDDDGDGDDKPRGANNEPADGYGFKADIKAKLTEKGIAFGPRDTREELIALLTGAE